MNAKQVVKCLIFAWVIPLMMLSIVWQITPDPHQAKIDFQSVVFTPSDIRVEQKAGSRGSDHFELWLHHPDGRTFFHRDPESAPINRLNQRVPRKVPLKVIYSPSLEGNRLLEIAPSGAGEKAIWSFEDSMAEYAARRRLIYIIAGIWFVLGNVLLAFVWKVDVADSPPDDASRDSASQPH